MESYQTIRKKLLAETDKCELCGNRRGLDTHHIIPRVCGGPDTVDNLIVLCSGCHGKLTPHGLLTKAGLQKHTDECSHIRRVINFYNAVEAELTDGVRPDADTILQIFEREIFDPLLQND